MQYILTQEELDALQRANPTDAQRAQAFASAYRKATEVFLKELCGVLHRRGYLFADGTESIAALLDNKRRENPMPKIEDYFPKNQ